MQPRLKYTHLAPEGFALMSSLEHYLNTSTGLEKNLLDLVRLLASLINGCEYCIDLHTTELRHQHETPDRVDNLREWRSSDAYTHRERAAFGWTEAVTDIQEGHAPDPVYLQLRERFTESEAVHLTLAITTINAWNRLAISLGAFPGHESTSPAPAPQPPAADPLHAGHTEGDGGKVTVED